MDATVQLLLTQLEQAYARSTWHGPNLRNALRGVGLEEALWRPAPDRHNIWEYVLHCAYWKYMATRHVKGDLSRGNFPRKPANYPAAPEPATEKAWKADLDFLDQYHQELLAAVRALDPERLEQTSGRWKVLEHVFGAANHDTYHAGQIRLLRRLFESRQENP